MAAVRLVEWALPDEAVDATLGLEDPVDVLAAHGERGRLEACLLAGARLEQVGLEAAAFGPAQVHAEENLGPVLSVGPAGAGVDRDERVACVVLAREERVLLEAVELHAQRGDRGLDVGGHVAVHRQELLGVLVLLREPAVAL